MRPSTTWLATLLPMVILLSTGRRLRRNRTGGRLPQAALSGRGMSGKPPRRRARDSPGRRSKPPRRMRRNMAAAVAASSGTATSSRSGAIRKSWPTSNPRPRASWERPSSGLAVDAGLVTLDDPAVKHYPAIGASGPDNPRDRLAEITIRHLATMTAGFDDGRPPKLVYRPGTDGFYSNDGSNMLAELLTLRFGEDLAAVLKREVMDPIGVPPVGVEVARECLPGQNDQRPAEPRIRVRHHHHAPRPRPDRLPLLTRGRMERPAHPLPGIHPHRNPAHRPAQLRALLRVLLGQQRPGHVPRYAGRRLLGTRPGR